MSKEQYHNSAEDGTQKDRWSALLKAAVSEPGVLIQAYSAFHSYSLGNQIATMMECMMRGIPMASTCLALLRRQRHPPLLWR